MDLSDPLEAYPPEQIACHNDMLSVGMLPGEAAALPIRVLATVITASIFSAWCDVTKVRRKLLFFAHWASGLVYLLSEWAMATMILACWSDQRLAWVIKTWKFIELTADNMLAVTNLTICLQLAFIVASAYSMAPVPTLGSPKMVLIMVAVSALIPITAVPFWQEELVTTGTQYWIKIGPTQSSDPWVTISQFLLELCVACGMLLVVLVLVLTRRSELRKCWKAHVRIKYYFGLSCIAIAVNVAIGVGGLLWIAWKRDPRFIVAGWSMRHVHIALDTIVLYGVLVTPSEELKKARLEVMEDAEVVTNGPRFNVSSTTLITAGPPTSTGDASSCGSAPTGISVETHGSEDAAAGASALHVSRRIWPLLRGEAKTPKNTARDEVEDPPALHLGRFANI